MQDLFYLSPLKLTFQMPHCLKSIT